MMLMRCIRLSVPPWAWPEGRGRKARLRGFQRRHRQAPEEKADRGRAFGARTGGLSSPAEKFGGFPLEESLVDVIDEASRGFRVAPWALRRALFYHFGGPDAIAVSGARPDPRFALEQPHIAGKIGKTYGGEKK